MRRLTWLVTRGVGGVAWPAVYGIVGLLWLGVIAFVLGPVLPAIFVFAFLWLCLCAVGWATRPLRRWADHMLDALYTRYKRSRLT